MSDTLTPLDASFLLLERSWAPMHFGGLSLLDLSGRDGAPLTETELRAAVAQRFRRLRRLHQRPAFPWAGLRHAVWQRAEVDLTYHVRRHLLPAPGGRPELMELAARIHGRELDRRRPLWELHLVDGLQDGRQATLMKVHHSIADGIGGMDVARALFDRGPAGSPRATPPGPRSQGPRWLEPLQVLEGAGRFLAAGFGPPVPLFNRPVGPRRAFAIATIPSRDLTAAKHRLGGTVDDVLLEVVSAGLTRYLEPTSNCLPPAVRMMVPISTRGLVGGAPGNHVTAMFVDVPLGVDADSFLARVSTAKGLLRQLHEGPALAALVRASGLLPGPLQGAVVRLVTGTPTFNLVVSDIPGPAEPFYLLGARVEAMYPLMPLAPASGVSIAAVSAGGVVGIGVTADPAQCPDPARLAAEIESAARELGRRGVRQAPARNLAAARKARRRPRSCAPGSPAAAASTSASARRPLR
jgi:diacylglycerol O-acyltransferase / wax synthase